VLRLEPLRIEIRDPGVLRDRPLDVLGRTLGHLGLDLDGDPQLRAGERRRVREHLLASPPASRPLPAEGSG
jgi:hypothetical protein